MKNMKVLTLVVLCMMLVFSLAACSGGGKDNKKAEDPPVSEKAQEPAEEATVDEEKPETAEPTIDLGGRSIRISMWWDGTPAGEDASSQARRERIAELEEKYNMKIEWVNVPWGEYVDKFTTTVLAGEPFADVVRMEYKWALPAILNGQLLPLSEFTSPASNLNNEANLVIKLFPIGGGEYGFIQPGVGGASMHYNRDLFKKLGLPDLHELYNSGQWTWEKFLEIAKAATKDTDNDGNIDTWGYAGWVHPFAKALTAANGAKIVDDQAGTQSLNDPRVIEALEFVNRMWNVENVVQNKTGNKTAYEEIDTFRDGNAAMFMAANWQIPVTSGEDALPFDYGTVPIPVGPQGSPDFTFADDGGHGYFIPKGVKDPQIVYQIFEEMEMIPELEDFPGQNWLESLYNHEEDVIMIRDNITGTGMIVLDGAYPGFPWGDVVNEIIGNNASVSATVESFVPQAQEAVDSLK